MRQLGHPMRRASARSHFGQWTPTGTRRIVLVRSGRGRSPGPDWSSRDGILLGGQGKRDEGRPPPRLVLPGQEARTGGRIVFPDKVRAPASTWQLIESSHDRRQRRQSRTSEGVPLRPSGQRTSQAADRPHSSSSLGRHTGPVGTRMLTARGCACFASVPQKTEQMGGDTDLGPEVITPTGPNRYRPPPGFMNEAPDDRSEVCNI